MRDYGRLFGIHLGLIAPGLTLAPWLFGQLYRSTGTYQSTLMVCGPLFLTGALALLALGRYPVFDRNAPLFNHLIHVKPCTAIHLSSSS